MIKEQHIDEEVAKHVDTLAHVRDLSKADAEEIFKFYIDSSDYTEVHLVKCDGCGKNMCLEVLSPATQLSKLKTHHQGRERITLGDAMLSHRKRLDGVMGYRCICGNNTILSSPESNVLPKLSSPMEHISAIDPHHVAKIQRNIKEQSYTPDVEQLDNGVRIESFTIERLK